MQVRGVTSDSLEAKIRELLPSQNGFTEELSAQNLIVPIIDMTAAAEGSTLPLDLARSIAFGSQTAFEVNNTTADIATVPGFYRVTGGIGINDIGASVGGGFTMTDGATVKQVWALLGPGTSTLTSATFDLTFWVSTGITLTVFSDNAGATVSGSVRQVATSEGTLVNPSGYPL